MEIYDPLLTGKLCFVNRKNEKVFIKQHGITKWFKAWKRFLFLHLYADDKVT